MLEGEAQQFRDDVRLVIHRLLSIALVWIVNCISLTRILWFTFCGLPSVLAVKLNSL
jgi:hypothetical protein